MFSPATFGPDGSGCRALLERCVNLNTETPQLSETEVEVEGATAGQADHGGNEGNGRAGRQATAAGRSERQRRPERRLVRRDGPKGPGRGENVCTVSGDDGRTNSTTWPVHPRGKRPLRPRWDDDFVLAWCEGVPEMTRGASACRGSGRRERGRLGWMGTDAMDDAIRGQVTPDLATTGFGGGSWEPSRPRSGAN